ncbi:MAG TPA: glycosyltransferase family A protein [Patescibacteria group bacterium]|nr:glycosyltransferase family A protein [Patescibacteria group bacterium]
MNPSRISVIIPTYQHAGTIVRCLESVFGQTLPPAEVIVVNDGSKDRTEEILAPYAGRIILINQENQGSNPARNRGFAVSSGERVIFCDADVVMHPEMLEKLSDALDADPRASYAYSSFRFGWKKFHGFPFDAERLRRMNYIHTTALIRREAFPGFDPLVYRLQDWDLWLTLLSKGRIGTFVPEELFRVFVESKSRLGTQWRPSILYTVPWDFFGWRPTSIAKYESAREIVLAKHRLS